MASDAKGVGHFTAENIAAVLRALPETDGTYQQLMEQAREYGSDVTKATLGKWVSTGRTDIRAGNRQTASPKNFPKPTGIVIESRISSLRTKIVGFRSESSTDCSLSGFGESADLTKPKAGSTANMGASAIISAANSQ